MTSPLILVTGSTGTIGSEAVRQLVQGGHRVRAMMRDPAKAAKLRNAAEIVTADLTRPETLASAFAGVDKAFVVSNGADIAKLEANAFDAAKKAGVKHIVKLSGRHHDADFMAGAALARSHNESEERLRGLGIAWTILRPGLFASNFLIWLVRDQRAVFLPVGQGRDTPTDPRDIAAVAVKALTEPGHDGKIYELTGPEFLSYAAMVQKMAEKIGTPLKLVDVPKADAHAGMMAAGVPSTQADGLLQYFDGVKAGHIYPPTQTIAEVLGRPPRSFDAWLDDHAAALRG
ncbi:MAG: SDR family oxidoreductase [Rhodospirillales bacterium]|nr:SDR family oxidoreductase [Rhodospirillales bacterium]